MIGDERSYLNVLKGLLIVFVVIGHFGQTISNNLPTNISFVSQGIILFIYLFHMPLFIFVSGYLSKNDEKRRRHAFGDLFVPYLVFQLFVGGCMFLLTSSTEVFNNIFVPQMGAWYLLTIFSYRIILPEIRNVRGIIVIGVFLTVFTCLMKGIGGEFALKKTFGFFVFFIAGYKMDTIPKDKINKSIARILLLVIIVLFIVISYKVQWYSIALSVLSRGANSDSFSSWYIAPIVYLGVFLSASIVMFLVINAIPEQCRWLEKHGKDTLPMYLSHLILFMAGSYFINKNNWGMTVAASIIFIILSLVLFSSDLYRKIFNTVMGKIKNLIFYEV